MTRIGLDVGGTKTRGIVLDVNDQIIGDVTRPTTPGAEGVLATAVEVTEECMRLCGMDAATLRGIGVGIPGRVDPDAGVVHTAVNLGLEELALSSCLRARFAVPVTVDNDVKVAAIGAASYLSQPNLTLINFGTGVACATLVDGKPVRGSDNIAGELGHTPIDPQGPDCACGQRGCVEVFAGGRNVAARLAALDGVELPTLAMLAATGHLDALHELTLLTTAIATTVELAVLAYGSPCVAIGGGVIHTAAGIEGHVRAELERRGQSSAFVRSLTLGARLTVLPPEAPVAVLGAALLG